MWVRPSATKGGMWGLLLVAILASCTTASEPIAIEAPAANGATATGSIVWIDSYHAEYEWSAAIETGIRSVLDDTGVDLEVVRLDTKRVSDESARQAAAADAAAEIERIGPDVVIATDDNAQRYLIVPYLDGTATPVVFAGVNWDATPYGYPTSNITGMIEVDLVQDLVQLLAPHASGDRVGVLSGDTETDRKLAAVYNERFFANQLIVRYVADYAEFKTAFVEMQSEVDLLIIGNNAGITDWDAADAEAWLAEHTTIPTGGTQTWVGPYVLMALGGMGEEQGEYAATAALDILQGSSPTDIPVVENTRGKLVANLVIADALDIALSPSILRNAVIHDPGGGP